MTKIKPTIQLLPRQLNIEDIDPMYDLYNVIISDGYLKMSFLVCHNNINNINNREFETIRCEYLSLYGVEHKIKKTIDIYLLGGEEDNSLIATENEEVFKIKEVITTNEDTNNMTAYLLGDKNGKLLSTPNGQAILLKYDFKAPLQAGESIDDTKKIITEDNKLLIAENNSHIVTENNINIDNSVYISSDITILNETFKQSLDKYKIKLLKVNYHANDFIESNKENIGFVFEDQEIYNKLKDLINKKCCRMIKTTSIIQN